MFSKRSLFSVVLRLMVPCLILLPQSALTQQPADPTQMPSTPFAIKATWTIGGSGSWDYLTMDVSAQRLYIAHSHVVQAVDITTGTVAGQITGLVEAHQVVLDDTGEFGYISDGAGGKIIVFDRRTLATVATIDDVPSPRSLVFEPQTRLLFAIQSGEAPAPQPPSHPRTTTHITARPALQPKPPVNPRSSSFATIIDTQTLKVISQIRLPGMLGFAQTDGRGGVFINDTDRNQVLFIDAEGTAALIAQQRKIESDEALAHPDAPAAVASAGPSPGSAKSPTRANSAETAMPAPAVATINSGLGDYGEHREGTFRRFPLENGCTNPKSLAIDSAHQRLFAACDNLKLVVLNAATGDLVATLPIGPDVDAIGYDPNRNLIYSANGGADGTLTIISQSVTDSYAVIQTLPTRQRARTLAVNTDNGQVYLVTDLLGVNLAQSANLTSSRRPGTVTTNPVNGTFQVLVIGN